MIKKIENASLKVLIFLYYAGELENKKCTYKFPDFEQDVTQFEKAALERLEREYREENKSDVWTWEDYKKDFGWVVKSWTREATEKVAREVRDELVAEGFLWKKVYEKPWGRSGKGKRITTYIGLTEKGKKWAPKYIAKYGKVVEA